MARIRHIDIRNFRCIEQLSWWPSDGINCLIGPGDSGKSTLLDAIDYCLGARRTIQVTDADFCRLDVERPIAISITIGDLDDALRSLETYGPYLRSCDAVSKTIDDEPEAGRETVLTIRLHVGADLEPSWSLVSDRTASLDQQRLLNWSDRQRIAPTRLGSLPDNNLAWRRGSVLSRLTDERANTGASLANAARAARSAFGDVADAQLNATLKVVQETAAELGVDVGDTLRAMLDAHSISLSGGTVALHNSDGIPLRALGTGSSRLLLAGLQRRASEAGDLILIDEVEFGLEPHRLIRLLGSLGAKEADPPLQAFISTHSPVAIRELRAGQLHVLRCIGGAHSVASVGDATDVQGTVRAFPEAFLASSVIICEGATEVGLLRGIDQHWVSEKGFSPLMAQGVALVDAGGCSKLYGRASAFTALGYRCAVLRDDDVQPDTATESSFTTAGNAVFTWATGNSTESELFASLDDAGVQALLEYAVATVGEALVDDHIKSASKGVQTLTSCRANSGAATRQVLASAAHGCGWYKSVGRMEDAARTVIGPSITAAKGTFSVDPILEWASG